STDDMADGRLARQPVRQRMLAGAGTENQQSHGKIFGKGPGTRRPEAAGTAGTTGSAAGNDRCRGRYACDTLAHSPLHGGGCGRGPPRKGRCSRVAEVKVQEGESIESALRRFKRKVQQEDIIKDIKKHSFYLKPGDKRRAKQALARKRNRKKMRRELE